jgi:AAA15 family ATPase/GTPase
MLNEVTLENFKPFGTKQVAKLSNITLIYGPNSGGKSSLIQALILLRQSIEGFEPLSSDLITRGEYIDLGSFKSLVHKHEVGRELISITSVRPAGSIEEISVLCPLEGFVTTRAAALPQIPSEQFAAHGTY